LLVDAEEGARGAQLCSDDHGKWLSP